MNIEPFYAPNLKCGAFRGGWIMALGSSLWLPWSLSKTNSAGALNWCLWLACLWPLFPAGAFLGGEVIRRIRSMPAANAAIDASVAAFAAGFCASVGVFCLLHSGDLIGLVANRKSGGYASFRFGVLSGLAKDARLFAVASLPSSTAFVWMWLLIARFRGPKSTERAAAATPTVRLGLCLRHAQIAGAVVLTPLLAIILVGVVMILIAAVIRQRPAGVSFDHPLDTIFGLAGLAVIGPWMGSVVNPGGADHHFQWILTAIAAPPLVAVLIPFVCQVTLRRSRATALWCLYTTSLLGWLCAGLFSAGSAMG